MGKVQWVWFCLQLLFEYGPKFVEIGRAIYKEVEKMFEGVNKRREDSGLEKLSKEKIQKTKVATFDAFVKSEWRKNPPLTKTNPDPMPDDIGRFRQRIWVRENLPKVSHMDPEEVKKILDRY